MDVLTVLPSLALALMWGFAATVKMATRAKTSAMASQLGVPSSLVPFAGLGLPIVEYLLAAGILIPSLRSVAALASALILVAFTFVIIRQLRSRKPLSCNCFGVFSRSTLSWRSVVRNAGLILLSVAAFLGARVHESGYSASAILFALAIIVVLVLVGLLAAILWLMVGIVRQQGALVDRLTRLEGQGAPVLADPPPFRLDLDMRLPSLSAGEVELRSRLSQVGLTAIVVLSESCPPCRDIVATGLSEWSRAYNQYLDFVVVLESATSDKMETTGSVAFTSMKNAWPEALVVSRGAIQALGLAGTPAGVIVSPMGEMVSGPHYGAEDIEAAMSSALALSSAKT